MDKQIATLEKLMAEWLADAANLRRAGVNAPWFDQGQASSLERCADNLRAAIALMRGQSEGGRKVIYWENQNARHMVMPDSERHRFSKPEDWRPLIYGDVP